MKARSVYEENFTRGGDPYKKLKMGGLHAGSTDDVWSFAVKLRTHLNNAALEFWEMLGVRMGEELNAEEFHFFEDFIDKNWGTFGNAFGKDVNVTFRDSIASRKGYTKVLITGAYFNTDAEGTNVLRHRLPKKDGTWGVERDLCYAYGLLAPTVFHKDNTRYFTAVKKKP